MTETTAEAIAKRYTEGGLPGVFMLISTMMEVDAGRRTKNKTPEWSTVPKESLLTMSKALAGLADTPTVKELSVLVGPINDGSTSTDAEQIVSDTLDPTDDTEDANGFMLDPMGYLLNPTPYDAMWLATEFPAPQGKQSVPDPKA
jgi:hypothetical protein